jgi:hypothetical protein
MFRQSRSNPEQHAQTRLPETCSSDPNRGQILPNHQHVLVIIVNPRWTSRSCKEVIHIQPCYNPSLTYQTTNCVVRYPQDKMVYVHYLYANDSIELRVNELRNRKRGKAAGLFDPDDEVLQSIEEIRSWEEEDLENNVSLVSLLDTCFT